MGRLLVLAVDAGNEQAVELVFFLRRQAVDERVGQIGHGAAEIGHAVILRELLCVALSVGVGRLLLIIVIAAVRLLLLLLITRRNLRPAAAPAGRCSAVAVPVRGAFPASVLVCARSPRIRG